MKILFHSYRFLPSLGGIELVGELLVNLLLEMGHEVRILTENSESRPRRVFGQAEVIRRASPYRKLLLLIWADVCIQNNFSFPLFIWLRSFGKPVAVIHHTWLSRTDGTITWKDKLKRAAAKRATVNAAVSTCLAQSISEGCTVFCNPYRETLFDYEHCHQRDGDLLFVGRLVSDKGCLLLLQAFANLHKILPELKLTIIGDGCEKAGLEEVSRNLSLDSRVNFLGSLSPRDVAQAMKAHKLLVIPSLWPEPFGVVALEGIACGMRVVGSDGGGLPEAIGTCGITFRTNDVDCLTKAVLEGLATPSPARETRSAHLAKHKSQSVKRQLHDLLIRLT